MTDVEKLPWFKMSAETLLVCNHLFSQTPICDVLYQRVYTDGSRTILCSNPLVINHAYVKPEAKLKQVHTPSLLRSSERYCLASSWAQNIRNKVLSNIYKTQQKEECILFGIKDEFWICEDKPEYLEAITFWVNETYYHADNFYINNLSILEQFRLYFLDKAKELISIADSNRIIKPWRNLDSNVVHIDKLNKPLFWDKLVNSDIQKSTLNIMPKKIHFNISGIDSYVTEKEIKCALQLIHGKSSKEIASNLFISPRTVETHINSLKDKTGTVNRGQLIDFLLELGISRILN